IRIANFPRADEGRGCGRIPGSPESNGLTSSAAPKSVLSGPRQVRSLHTPFLARVLSLSGSKLHVVQFNFDLARNLSQGGVQIADHSDTLARVELDVHWHEFGGTGSDVAENILEMSIRNGIRQLRGQMEFLFEPRVDTSDGRINCQRGTALGVSLG